MPDTFDGVGYENVWVAEVTSPVLGDEANGDEIRDADLDLARRDLYLKTQLEKRLAQGTENESLNTRGVPFGLSMEAGVLSRVKTLTSAEANSTLALDGTFDVYRFDGRHVLTTAKTWTIAAPTGAGTSADTSGRSMRIVRGPGAEEGYKSVHIYSALAGGGGPVLLATLPASGGWLDLVVDNPVGAATRQWIINGWGGIVWFGLVDNGGVALATPASFGW